MVNYKDKYLKYKKKYFNIKKNKIFGGSSVVNCLKITDFRNIKGAIIEPFSQDKVDKLYQDFERIFFVEIGFRALPDYVHVEDEYFYAYQDAEDKLAYSNTICINSRKYKMCKIDISKIDISKIDITKILSQNIYYIPQSLKKIDFERNKHNIIMINKEKYNYIEISEGLEEDLELDNICLKFDNDKTNSQKVVIVEEDGLITLQKNEAILSFVDEIDKKGMYYLSTKDFEKVTKAETPDRQKEIEQQLQQENGNVIINYRNGDKYEGQWEEGKKNGQGTWTDTNGAMYKGEFLKGEFHGKGTFTSANNERSYEGEWKEGKEDGLGTSTEENGRKYTGEFKDSKYHGKGTLILADGNKYEGQWNDDKQHGQGTWTDTNGNQYKGAWSSGLFNGEGTWTVANGRKYTGEFKDGKYHGKGTMIFANGDKYEGEFKEGVPQISKQIKQEEEEIKRVSKEINEKVNLYISIKQEKPKEHHEQVIEFSNDLKTAKKTIDLSLKNIITIGEQSFDMVDIDEEKEIEKIVSTISNFRELLIENINIFSESFTESVDIKLNSLERQYKDILQVELQNPNNPNSNNIENLKVLLKNTTSYYEYIKKVYQNLEDTETLRDKVLDAQKTQLQRGWMLKMEIEEDVSEFTT